MASVRKAKRLGAAPAPREAVASPSLGSGIGKPRAARPPARSSAGLKGAFKSPEYAPPAPKRGPQKPGKPSPRARRAAF